MITKIQQQQHIAKENRGNEILTVNINGNNFPNIKQEKVAEKRPLNFVKIMKIFNTNCFYITNFEYKKLMVMMGAANRLL